MAQKAVEKRSEPKFLFDQAFSSFSVDDLDKATEFYGDTLGLNVTEEKEGLGLDLGNQTIFVYPKTDHRPATFTILNFRVNDIDETVDALRELGITFESYGGELKTDKKGIFRGAESGNGPNIAWFKDPAGNFLSVMEGPIGKGESE